MSTRIVHLSDLHYGGSFDTSTWDAVKKQVEDFTPNIIIVSGDLADDPTEDRLRAVKGELDGLAAATGAELFVVPGNHDVSPFGIDLFGSRSALFYKIFNRETGTEQPRGAEQSDSAVQSGGTAFAKPGGFWKLLGERVKACTDFALHAIPRSQAPSATTLVSARQGEVLLALIDSNSANQTIRLATGSISKKDLFDLDSHLTNGTAKMGAKGKAHLVRIAVLHHHVLPAEETSDQIIGAEPLMVLHNAGELRAVLARHHFDLILHGHKHHQQLTRIEWVLGPGGRYPMLVAAAGSAALKTNDPAGNSFNLITIEDNGGIEVESIHYGGNKAPNRAGRSEETTYTESILDTKRRAFVRASDRYGVSARKEIFRFEITELGDLTLEHRTTRLWPLRNKYGSSRRPHMITIPKQGEVANEMQIDPISVKTGYRIDSAPATTVISASSRTRRLERLVVLPPLKGDSEASYTVRHRFSNSVMMTRWEAAERARGNEQEGMPRGADWDQEGVGCTIRHPIEKLQLQLSLPDSLARVFPYLCCERQAGFPNFSVTQWGDAELSADAPFERDVEMDAAVRFVPYFENGIWRLPVERPIVGYRYRLRWTIPGQRPGEPVCGETKQCQQLLLAMADNQTSGHEKVQIAFSALADAFGTLLAWGGAGETWRVDLLVYDAGKLALRSVARRSSQPPREGWQFSVGLGNGISGAAFLKRVIVPWAKDHRTAFARPDQEENPDDLHAMLAAPLFHPVQYRQAVPSPSGTIGVVCFSSPSPSCKVPDLLNEVLSGEAREMTNLLNGVALDFVCQTFAAVSAETLADTAKTEALD